MNFFDSTRYFREQFSNSNTFIESAQVALWHLRREIEGLVEDFTSLTNAQLVKRFAKGSRITSADIKRACIDTTWDKQQEVFAQILLVDVISLFEGWISSVLHELGCYSMEYESGLKSYSNFRRTISSIRGTESEFIREEIFPSLSKNVKFNGPALENQFACYRCFKEIRNCLSHGGGVANKRCLQSLSAYSSVANPGDLNMKTAPIILPMVENKPIILSFYGVIGFCDLIMRIIVSLDAELSYAKLSEDLIAKRWKNRFDFKICLKTNLDSQNNQVARLLKKIRVVRPQDFKKTTAFLREKGFVSI